MTEIWRNLQLTLSLRDPLFWLTLLDLLLVSYLIYRLLLLFKGTKAAQIIQGILFLVSLYFAAKALELRTITWLLDQIFASSVLILVILFQNNIRRILPKLALNPFNRQTILADLGDQRIPEIVRSVELLASKKIGALIVIEREAELTSYIQQGTELDALASKELLFNLFLPYAPLHDGAAILHNGRVTRAGCFLPLTIQPEIPKHLGTRHRAGIGITEQTDAISIIVSETDGRISLCQDGKLKRIQTPSDLNNELTNRLRLPSTSPKSTKKSDAPDKPKDDKSTHDHKLKDDKPKDDKPKDKEPTPKTERPPRPKEEKNSATDKAASDKPPASAASTDKAASDKPSTSAASTDKAASDKPPASAASTDKAASDKPPASAASTDKAASDKPPASAASTDKTTSDKPPAEKHKDDKSASERLKDDKAPAEKAKEKEDEPNAPEIRP